MSQQNVSRICQTSSLTTSIVRRYSEVKSYDFTTSILTHSPLASMMAELSGSECLLQDDTRAQSLLGKSFCQRTVLTKQNRFLILNQTLLK